MPKVTRSITCLLLWSMFGIASPSFFLLSFFLPLCLWHQMIWIVPKSPHSSVITFPCRWQMRKSKMLCGLWRLSSPLVLKDCTLNFFKDSGWCLEEIKKIFSNKKIPLALNQTHITLIPKIKAHKPLKISDLLVYATLSTRLLIRLLWLELDRF